MANREEDYLYCLVFDKPIHLRSQLVLTLKTFNCKEIKKGPTDFSIEFRLKTDNWTQEHWQYWDKVVKIIQKDYKFNWERSCLPERGGDRDGEDKES